MFARSKEDNISLHKHYQKFFFPKTVSGRQGRLDKKSDRCQDGTEFKTYPIWAWKMRKSTHRGLCAAAVWLFATAVVSLALLSSESGSTSRRSATNASTSLPGPRRATSTVSVASSASCSCSRRRQGIARVDWLAHACRSDPNTLAGRSTRTPRCSYRTHIHQDIAAYTKMHFSS